MHLGGGGALLREKMVEVVSDKFICIVDESKLSKVGKYNNKNCDYYDRYSMIRYYYCYLSFLQLSTIFAIIIMYCYVFS